MAETTNERHIRRQAEKAERESKARDLPPKKVAWGLIRRHLMKLDASDLALSLYMSKKVSPAKGDKLREMVEKARQTLVTKIDRSLGEHRDEATKGFAAP